MSTFIPLLRKERLVGFFFTIYVLIYRFLFHIRNFNFNLDFSILTSQPITFCFLNCQNLPGRGWAHRNLAIKYAIDNYKPGRKAVLYFADDDNTYDIRLFDKYIRRVKNIGFWAVGKLLFNSRNFLRRPLSVKRFKVLSKTLIKQSFTLQLIVSWSILFY